MFAKYGLLILALLVVWYALLRPGMLAAKRQPKPKGPPGPAPAELKPCPKCGVYRLPGGPCDCTSAPTQRD